MNHLGIVAHTGTTTVETEHIPWPDPENCKCDKCKPKGRHDPWDH